MRAKNSKTTNGNPELIEALEAIAREKDISKEVLLEAIQNSLLAACKDQFGKSDNIRVVLDETTEFHVYQDKVVVEEVLDDTLEIALAEAEARHGVTDLGATVSIEVTPKNFGRISAQKAKQVVVQKIREEERKVLYDQYYTKEKDIITPEFKEVGSKIVKFEICRDQYEKPNYECMMKLYDAIHEMTETGVIVAAYALDGKGLAAAVSKMAFGNKLGVTVNADVTKETLFAPGFGNIVAEVPENKVAKAQEILAAAGLAANGAVVGAVNDSKNFIYGDMSISMDEAIEAWKEAYVK